MAASHGRPAERPPGTPKERAGPLPLHCTETEGRRQGPRGLRSSAPSVMYQGPSGSDPETKTGTVLGAQPAARSISLLPIPTIQAKFQRRAMQACPSSRRAIQPRSRRSKSASTSRKDARSAVLPWPRGSLSTANVPAGPSSVVRPGALASTAPTARSCRPSFAPIGRQTNPSIQGTAANAEGHAGSGGKRTLLTSASPASF